MTTKSAQAVRAAVRQSLARQGFNVDAYPRVSCDHCEALVISGIPCHETGCPNQINECRGCNASVPRGVRYCADCL